MKYWKKEWGQDIYEHLRKYGAPSTLFKIASSIISVLYDVYYHIDTELRVDLDEVFVIGENKSHSYGYHPTYYLPTRMIFRKIKNIFPENTSFVDFGCGKGRALLTASEFGIKTVKGIDFSPDFCEIAKKNIRKYIKHTGCRTTFNVYELDALDYSISAEDNIIFLFNPFDDTILNRLLDKIEESLEKDPRFLIIIYVYPQHGQLIESRSFCKMIKKYNIWSSFIHIYLNEDRDIAL